ncbi:sporulation histidine kinase inhibitor Sda [Alkalihalophilus lindianensis]|uniref:Sporulation histidine kinase inhibitor Sda n=1 Tax=Alkalihalophilus lindianensis TaxID=1630542 RepID=A0ABU3X851_9BACI|nr:sporulation histidine kinase inhibitor Sda [Alkalihalophilus lindianensis]MDV2684060.1 sporulation histidine kinase inhibitor Sda [Alkalihalophilus lindianensis]
MLLHNLDDKFLITTYHESINLKIEQEFIIMLEKEIGRRVNKDPLNIKLKRLIETKGDL